MATRIGTLLVEGAWRGVGQTIATGIIMAVCLVFGFSPKEWMADTFWFNPPDWLVHPTTRLLVLLVGVALIFLVVMWPFGKAGNANKARQRNEPDNSVGPVYWEAVEALSWIAVGKPIKSGTWMSDTLEQELIRWPDDLSKRFDDAEREFFERIRGGDIEAFAIKEGEHVHAKIPAAHFLGPVAINILHNTLGVDSTNIEDVFEYKGPKYSKLQVKRTDVLKFWPEGGVEFTWPVQAEKIPKDPPGDIKTGDN